MNLNLKGARVRVAFGVVNCGWWREERGGGFSLLPLSLALKVVTNIFHRRPRLFCTVASVCVLGFFACV